MIRRILAFVASTAMIAAVILLFVHYGDILAPLILMAIVVHIFRLSPEPAKESTLYPVDEVPVCPHCFAENHPWTTFCRKCTAPQSSYANIGYMERVYSWGWLMVKIVSGRLRRRTLIAVWLVFGSGFLVPLVFLVGLLNRTSFDWLEALLLLPSCALSAAFLARVTWNYYHKGDGDGAWPSEQIEPSPEAPEDGESALPLDDPPSDES